MSDRSEALFRQALEVLPGGVSRNTLLRDPHPYYVASGSGCTTVDIDGVERIDFANNMASLIHGHAYPPVVEAVIAQLWRGSAFTMATEAEIRFAQHLCARSPGFDKLRFVNSGTEAVMAGLKAARAFTNRPKIAKVEGSYHGAYDYAEVSQSPSPSRWGQADRPASVPLAVGTPEGIAQDVVVLPLNDPTAATSILDDHHGQIACVLVDPMPHKAGLVPVQPAFIRALRDWTRTDGALLMFDEVITFRTEFGGMQDRLDTQPDLTALGKMIGGGFPVGAIAGRDEVMAVFAPGSDGPRLPHSGTFSANPVTMVAGYQAMTDFDASAVARLNGLGDRARKNLLEAIAVSGAPASVTGTGSMFRIHMKAEAPRDYRSAYATPNEKRALSAFLDHMGDAGILLTYSAAGILSTPMGEAEIDKMADVAIPALAKSMKYLP
jgi:glutamate-1-semialdehyde 2,1-aminomutase